MNALACIFIFCFFSLCASQTYTAQFTVTASQYNHGYFNGIMYYDWTQDAFLLQFPKAGQYAELYVYNSNRGYPGYITGQFGGQYQYKNSSICACETITLNSAMPPLNPTLTTTPAAWGSAGPATTFPRGSCNLYTANPALTTTIGSKTVPYNIVSSLWALTDGTPCAFNLTDGRQFTLTTLDTSPIPPSIFAPPTGCKCGKPLDLVISLDRTGSIQYWEWVIEHEFTKNLSLAFDYGPLKTNLAITDWNSAQWTTIQLTAGTSADAVSTAIDNMGCCVPYTSQTASCCCCGTPIGGGLYMAGQMMMTSTRPTATKVIILVTDGCQNHMFDPSTTPPTVAACPCSTELSCASVPSCVADITTYYNFVTQSIPGIKIIAVGVGNDQSICTNQLNSVAGNNLQNVYNPKSWQSLSSIVQSLSATACTVDDSACVGCCGICSCGQCITPVDCISPDLCSIGVVDPNSQCCTSAPLSCNAKDLCHTSSCNISVGCVDTPITCPADTNCTKYACDSTVGFCKGAPNGNPACNKTTEVIPECFANTDCNDHNLCTIDVCSGGNCFWNRTICGTNNACVNYSCDPRVGCTNITKVCNDKNFCTIDSCDTTTGCHFVNKTCNVTTDRCLITQCEPSFGTCVTTRNPCANITSTNCTIPGCVNNTCTRINVCLPPPPPTGTSDVPLTTVIATSLGVAAVVGIIVAAVIIFLGLAGGGAFAYAQSGAVGGAVNVANNPLYCGTGKGADNPLFHHKA